MTKNSKYRNKILKETKKYYDKLDEKDFSHNSSHFFRVENLVKEITKTEKADLEILEAAALMFDIARSLEVVKKIKDHAEEGAKIAEKILLKIKFPKNKIQGVCHVILAHRRNRDVEPKTIEAKILCDADRLEAMGAISVARVIASSLQSPKYRRPIFVEKIKSGNNDTRNLSAIHFMVYMINHKKHQPNNFYTKMGKKMAVERMRFLKEYVKRFVEEWRGVK